MNGIQIIENHIKVINENIDFWQSKIDNTLDVLKGYQGRILDSQEEWHKNVLERYNDENKKKLYRYQEELKANQEQLDELKSKHHGALIQ